MYTQCSKCETVFRLSADSLRVADGQVRCGRCGEVFNALARLADDSTGFTMGETPLELETRADEILESVPERLRQAVTRDTADTGDAVHAVDAPHPAPGTELAQLQFIEPIDDFFESDPQPREQPRRTLEFAAWSTAAVVLGVLLLVQLVRGNREWLAALMPPDANLSSYQLHQSVVTGEPAANGTLQVRASITNTTTQVHPYPLLRVSLGDRFGSRIGARDFEASEYLGAAAGSRMLAPGERADIVLDILDPGRDAEGFEMDVCLRRADESVVCASDIASQTRR